MSRPSSDDRRVEYYQLRISSMPLSSTVLDVASSSWISPFTYHRSNLHCPSFQHLPNTQTSYFSSSSSFYSRILAYPSLKMRPRSGLLFDNRFIGNFVAKNSTVRSVDQDKPLLVKEFLKKSPVIFKQKIKKKGTAKREHSSFKELKARLQLIGASVAGSPVIMATSYLKGKGIEVLLLGKSNTSLW